jgi:hypothetical protein
LSARPLHAVGPAERDAPARWREPAAELAHVATRLGRELTEARRELASVAAENAHLQRKLIELQTWVDAAARFESVEQLQLSRLLALRTAERERRRLPVVTSLTTIFLLLYAAAAFAVAWRLIAGAV